MSTVRLVFRLEVTPQMKSTTFLSFHAFLLRQGANLFWLAREELCTGEALVRAAPARHPSAFLSSDSPHQTMLLLTLLSPTDSTHQTPVKEVDRPTKPSIWPHRRWPTGPPELGHSILKALATGQVCHFLPSLRTQFYFYSACSGEGCLFLLSGNTSRIKKVPPHFDLH